MSTPISEVPATTAAAPHRMNARAHVFEEHRLRECDLDELPALIASGAPLWIDTWDGGQGLADFFERVLHLHPLAIEDILREPPQPKVEDYGDYLYLVVHGVQRAAPADDSDEVASVELDVVLTRSWVLTHHAVESQAVADVERELRRNPRLLERGPAFIAHALLDHVIDCYVPLIEDYDAQIEEVEAQAIAQPTPAVMQRILRIKRSLQRMRRTAVYQREALLRLARGEFDLLPAAALPFYRDVYDHFVRVADLADSYRDLLAGVLDAYLSVVSNRMNEVMKALTLVATVMLPLTFIVGVYGMNFEFMPELHWKYGYLYVWALMLVVAVAMVWWFRRKRWM